MVFGLFFHGCISCFVASLLRFREAISHGIRCNTTVLIGPARWLVKGGLGLGGGAWGALVGF